LIATGPASPTDTDPTLPSVGTSFVDRLPSAWTDGFFEFHILVLYNAKDGTGVQIPVDFGARPIDLYDIEYTHAFHPMFKIYRITSIKPKEFFPNARIATWGLQNFGTAWKYHIYEKNTEVDVETSSSVTTTHANNFEVTAEGTLFKLVKVGGKYGGKTENTSTQSVKLRYKQGSTDLGSKVSYFYDPVIVGKGFQSVFGPNIGFDYYNTLELDPGGSSGYVFLSVEPWSVTEAENL